MKYFVGLLYLTTLIALTYAGTKFEYNDNVNEDEEQELMEHKIEDDDEEMVEDFIGMQQHNCSIYFCYKLMLLFLHFSFF